MIPIDSNAGGGKASKLLPNTLQQNLKYELSKAKALADDSFNCPSPAGTSFLPFQAAGIHYATYCEHTLFADPPGLGKTIQSIGHANAENFQSGLILCPTSLQHNWKRELEKWSTVSHKIEIYHPKTFDVRGDRTLLIFPYSYASMLGAVKQVLEWQKFRGKIDWMSLDEVHYLKNTEAKRTKYVFAKNGLIARAKRVHALSGTPIVNRPMELYPVIANLAPQSIGAMSKFEYGIHFCAGFKGPWGWDFSGASNLKLLGMKLRSHFMVRRNKEDVLTDLPDKYPPNLVYIDPSKKAGGLIQEFKTFDTDLAIKRAVTADFTEISRVRRELGEDKIEAGIEYLKTQLEGGHEKIVVFAHHKSVIDGLEKGLSEFRPVSVKGDTDPLDRQKAVDRFQQDKTTRLFIASIGAGSVGFTLTAASYVVFVEFSWVPGENEQAIDRTHRIGQTKAVQVDFLVHEGSLDERVLKVLLGKMKAINEFHEGAE